MADSGRKEIQKYVFATAYVVKSIGIRLGIKLFINFHGANEGIPRNIFKTKQKAISWLTEIEEKQKAKKLVH
jgi:hypothetical protein